MLFFKMKGSVWASDHLLGERGPEQYTLEVYTKLESVESVAQAHLYLMWFRKALFVFKGLIVCSLISL